MLSFVTCMQLTLHRPLAWRLDLDFGVFQMLCCPPCSHPKQAVPSGQQQHQGSAPAVAAAEAGLLKPIIAAAVRTGTEPLKAAAELHAHEHAGEVTPSGRQEDSEQGFAEGAQPRWAVAQLGGPSQAAELAWLQLLEPPHALVSDDLDLDCTAFECTFSKPLLLVPAAMTPLLLAA